MQLDVNELTTTLREHYKQPLLLCIENGCIAASEFTEGGAYDYAICFEHPEGSIPLGFDHPSNAEYYEFDPRQLGDDYATNRSIVNVACGFDASDDPPWAEFDESGASLSPDDAEASMHAWLEARVRDEIVEGLGDELSEFTPGLAIYEALSEHECRRFDLRRVNLGGPASSVPAVAFAGGASEFNSFLREKNLPYRIEQEPTDRSAT